MMERKSVPIVLFGIMTSGDHDTQYSFDFIHNIRLFEMMNHWEKKRENTTSGVAHISRLKNTL